MRDFKMCVLADGSPAAVAGCPGLREVAGILCAEGGQALGRFLWVEGRARASFLPPSIKWPPTPQGPLLGPSKCE